MRSAWRDRRDEAADAPVTSPATMSMTMALPPIMQGQHDFFRFMTRRSRATLRKRSSE